MSTESVKSFYDFKTNESKWQNKFESEKLFKINEDSNNKKYYVLEQLPYPSGNLHMGHIRCYTIGDAVARFRRAQSIDVLHRMGFDAFGLPAENAAIEKNTHPKKWTYANIDVMLSQMKALGLSVDWDNITTTCGADYYKHQQKIFLDFLKNGIAYQKESMVNWDPVDKTVLANEQVIDGKGWRTGAPVEQKMLKQWFFRVSNYAEELLKGLDILPEWPEKVKIMQRNWIGKSDGAEIDFEISDNNEKITVFSTRPETLFGCAGIAISPLHSILGKLSLNKEKIENFKKEYLADLKNAQFDANQTKKGLKTELTVLHPFTKQVLPVYIANFVLMEYGTGAVFMCPAHDERDSDFCKNVLNLTDFVNVIDENDRMINSDFLNSLSVSDAKEETIIALEKSHLGKRKTTYKLRDWGVSRQRYWGCPIPVVYCPHCGTVPEKEQNLPVTLPDDVVFDGKGNPLEHHPTWKNCKCPKCGADATRETDTLDTFVDSSWYFLRYIDPKNTEKPFDEAKIETSMPVMDYVGGIEHAILHLLYSRFFTKALRDCGYFKNIQQKTGETTFEPFYRLLTQGMVCHMSYKDANGFYVEPWNIDRRSGKLYRKDNGIEVFEGKVEKMSKSKKNVVSPEEIIEKYGADTARMFMLSDSPLDRDIEWSESGIAGILKYFNRIWKLLHDFKTANILNLEDAQIAETTNREMHKAIHLCTRHMQNFEFNVTIAKLREFTNYLDTLNLQNISEDLHKTLLKCFKSMIVIISPIAPHFAESAWELLNQTGYACQQLWPECDESLLVERTVKIGVQVNGKIRGEIEVKVDESQDECVKQAMQNQQIAKYIQDQQFKKVIFVKNKIIGFVV